MKTIFILAFIIFSAGIFSGCQISLPNSGDNTLLVATPLDEPTWVRNGEPIQFEGENWYPTREIERFMDNEVYQIGVYREVVFFLDRVDVKPFERLYTRFAKGRYRAFERRE